MSLNYEQCPLVIELVASKYLQIIFMSIELFHLNHI